MTTHELASVRLLRHRHTVIACAFFVCFAISSVAMAAVAIIDRNWEAVDATTTSNTGDKSNDALKALRRGIDWSEKGDLDRAIMEFSEAIRLVPDFAAAFNSRGLAWANKKNFEKAIPDYNEAIRLAPKVTFIPYVNRGNAFREIMQYEKAIADFDKAIEMAPKRAEPFEARGVAWLQQKEIDKGIIDLTEAIRLNSKLVSAYGSRADAWLAKMDYEKAVADQSEAIRLDPTAKRYRYRSGTWHIKKEYAKAIEDCSEALRLDPKDHTSMVILARLWSTLPDARLRNGKQSLELATKAYEISKDLPCLEVLAAAHAELGNFDEAIRWQEKAVNHPQAKGLSYPPARLLLYQNKQPLRID